MQLALKIINGCHASITKSIHQKELYIKLGRSGNETYTKSVFSCLCVHVDDCDGHRVVNCYIGGIKVTVKFFRTWRQLVYPQHLFEFHVCPLSTRVFYVYIFKEW